METAVILEFAKFFVPLTGAAIAWFWNERQKRIAEEYVRKEQKYLALIDSLYGFYETAGQMSTRGRVN